MGESEEKPSKPELRVKKRSGQLVKFREEKILRIIGRAADSVDANVDVEKLTREVSARVRRTYTKVVTVEEIQDIVEDVFVKNDLTAVAKSFILYRKKRQEEREAKSAILGKVIRTDLSLNAIKLLHDRYLLRDENGKVIETPDEMFERVAGAIAEAEAQYAKDLPEAAVRKWKGRFKRAMTNLDLLPSSTVLMNAGLPDAQLAASCALPIQDHLKDIFGTLRDAVDLQRHGAGTGFDFSRLRERFAPVGEHGAISGGPLQFLHVFNEALAIIRQNGRRQGANMAILDVHHPDILDFISAKVKDYQLTNFNISVALSDEFVHAAVLDKEYDLITPVGDKAIKTMYAKQVFDILVASAWNYADPGVLFWDRIERDNPIPGKKLCATSPCAEFMLGEYELGFGASINLANFVIPDEKTGSRTIDYKRLRETVFLGIRMLDDVIDASAYPLQQCEKVVQQHRKVGLGVMGFAHLLYRLGIAYDSAEGIETARTLAKFIRAVAEEASFELAQERGVFPAWKRSAHAKRDLQLRNATLLAISPTGSTSIIAETSGAIEPVYALSYVKHTADGKELPYVDPFLKEALQEQGLLTNELIEKVVNHGIGACDEIPAAIKRVFVTTHDISPEAQVRMQAAWQEHVDNGVSKTVNLPHDATLLDVENVFLLAYRLGCKGVTVYREGTKGGQVLQLTTLMQKRGTQQKARSVREELRQQLSNKQLIEFSQQGVFQKQ